jgi:hypothetical protein
MPSSETRAMTYILGGLRVRAAQALVVVQRDAGDQNAWKEHLASQARAAEQPGRAPVPRLI